MGINKLPLTAYLPALYFCFQFYQIDFRVFIQTLLTALDIDLVEDGWINEQAA